MQRSEPRAFSLASLASLAPLFIAGLFTLPLAACGAQEVSAMTKFADQMCACKDFACAEKLFPEIDKMATANEGKEVIAAAADKYNSEMDRTQKCYEKLAAAADAAEPAEPAEPAKE